jgi:hypothetical protein
MLSSVMLEMVDMGVTVRSSLTVYVTTSFTNPLAARVEETFSRLGPVAASVEETLLRLGPVASPVDVETLLRLGPEPSAFGGTNVSSTLILPWQLGHFVPLVFVT